MIRELMEADRQQVLDFLMPESSFNLFLIGDIHNYGFCREFQQLWGDFDNQGKLRAVLLRYYGNYIPYSRREFDAEGFARLILERGDLKIFSGIREIVDRFRTLNLLLLDWANRRNLHFAELDRAEQLFLDGMNDGYQVRKGTIDDVPAMMALMHQIEEFAPNDSTEPALRQAFETGDGRTYVVTREGEVVAMARTTAENPHSAMIVGVATHPAHRRQGLASLVMSHLCREVLRRGKSSASFTTTRRPGPSIAGSGSGRSGCGAW
jgi:predicted GNAT family acetyltransferase